MKALSIRQPWAWLIVNGFKDIENRDWPTKLRGRVLVHAAKGMTHSEYTEARAFVYDLVRWHNLSLAAIERFPKFHDMQRGGIVGAVDIVDCVSRSDSRWFFGRHGFVLANAEVLPFRPYKGALGFFEVAP